MTRLKCTKITSIDSNFDRSSPSLSPSTSFFVLPNNFIVLRNKNSNS